MHGITNSAQRIIFKKYGADVVFSEMVSAMGLNYNNQKTIAKTKYSPKEKPIIIQVFGNTIDETIKAALFAQAIGADGIDFNCGCPARSMIASGHGGRLLLEPDKLIDILFTIKKNINLPLSLKTRIGYDQILPPSFYKKIVTQSHIDCLIIHGRTVKQKYQGQANWDQVKQISQSLSVPVIGSGDIVDPFQAVKHIKKYTPAGIMIGRGALGNPWIFQQSRAILSGIKIRPRFNIKKIIKIILEHSRLMIKQTGQEQLAIIQMRKHYGWYIKNFPQAKSYRQQLFQAASLKQVKKILTQL